MNLHSLAKALALAVMMISCTKEEQATLPAVISQPTSPTATVTESTYNSILVDASRDGGVWWAPQAGSFSPDAPHQGKALADYLRSLAYTVKELPRGHQVTWADLKPYKRVIRAVGFGNYTQQEIAAYDSLLNQSASLLLLADHLQNSSNDNLSAHLGLHFIGSQTGHITQLASHPTTAGVSTLPYIAGSIIVQPDPNSITILGYWA